MQVTSSDTLSSARLALSELDVSVAALPGDDWIAGITGRALFFCRFVCGATGLPSDEPTEGASMSSWHRLPVTVLVASVLVMTAFLGRCTKYFSAD